MKKTKKSIAETQVNVKEIMRSIEKKAKKHQIEEDVALLESIDIRKLEVTDSEVETLKNSCKTNHDSLDHNLQYINCHYALIDKYNPFSSHRKGVFRKFADKLLQKHFNKTKMFLDNIFSAQEMFNVKVVRIFNALVKEILGLNKKLDEQHDILDEQNDILNEQHNILDKQYNIFNEHTEKVKAEFSHFHTVFDEHSLKMNHHEAKIDQTLSQFKNFSATFHDTLKSQTESIQTMFSTFGENVSSQSRSLVDGVKQDLEQKFEATLDETKKSILYPHLELDYKKFQDRFRGSQQAITQKQKQYLRFFHECKNVMDIGCGRGEFIQLLHQNGSGAFGIEIDPEMVKECRAKNLNVVDVDAVSYLKIQLERETPDSIDGIFSAQVIEHLHMDYLIEMLRLCYRILQPDRFIVLETINVKCLAAFTASIYLDPTHVKPIHPETLQFILESLGFREIAFIFSSKFSNEEKLQALEPRSEQDTLYNQNVKKLNELLFAPQDYAIIAKK
ncbi:methyltransferase domain-containing protein [Candidatus Peregrinibacteria bacterium]|nr:methyltransferase domain-containing protein [Candidatus Peregrinibacteria bacterium]